MSAEASAKAKDATYHYYYDGQSMVEMRDDSDDVLTTYVWGAGYIDELVQIGLNDDPADGQEDDCETTYYGLQDANYNVLGLAESDGDLAERYEYTPYGQRTVYTDAGSNDTLVTAPILHSKPVRVGSADQSYGLCDFGHQGLMHDKEFGLIDNRRRPRHPLLGRFPVRDGGYWDGMSLYEYVASNPLRAFDAFGLWAQYDDNPHHWCAQPGDTLKSLATDPVYGYAASAEDRLCLWPLAKTCGLAS